MNSISNQILTVILIAVFAVFGGWGYLEIQNTKKSEAERIKKNQIRIAERLVYNLSYPVWNVDTREINTIIYNEAWDENVISIRVFDENSELYTGTIREKGQILNILDLPWYTIYPLSDATVVRPILRDKKPIGTLVIYPNKEPLQLLIRHLSFSLFLKITILTILLASIQFLILRRVIIKPLSQLKDWATSVGSNKMLPPTNVYHTIEIDELATSFLEMTNGLVSSHNEIAEKNRQLIESESRIKSISNNLTSGMIYQMIIKPDGTRLFTYLSKSVNALYGITPEQGIADSSLIYSNVHPDDIEALRDAEDKAMETLSTFKMEVRMRQVPGMYRWSSFVSSPTLLRDGSVRWDGIEFDITEQKHIEEELRVSQQKFAIAFNSSPDAIVISEQETGIIIETNEAIKNIFGYSREEVIGKSGLELNIYKDPADRLENFQILQKDGYIRNREVTRRHKSGSDLTLILSVELSNIDGKPCLIATIHDITERKKMEEELRVSQQKFAIAFHSSPDAIIITEQETGKIIEVNDAVKTVFGYSREELIGKTTLELNIYKNASERLQTIETLRKLGSIRNKEVTRKHKSGSDLILLMSIESTIIDGIPCLITTDHDITQRKQAEERLRESEERYKSIISLSNTGAWEYHSDTDYLWCSPEYFGMLGRKQADYDLSGKKNLQETWINLLHTDDKEAATNHFAEYLKNGSVGTYENHFRMLHADGSWKWVWARGQSLRDKTGNATNLTVGTHIDITERKLNEMELQKLNLDKDRFMSILGHDLRSPFNGIVGILDLLCTDIKDLNKGEIEELLKMADKSAHNASDLLDDVLMWAMAQSGKMTFAPIDFNFKEDCTHVIEILQSMADAKNIAMNLDAEDNLTVYADKNMLDTILRNLISNALKFTNEGGKVTISTKKTPDGFTISVADTGVGIEPKNVAKIFDKTQLFTSVGTADEKGTGFGLKLCQEFVEKHGGKIWIESELGKGTTFYFTLPNA